MSQQMHPRPTAENRPTRQGSGAEERPTGPTPSGQPSDATPQSGTAGTGERPPTTPMSTGQSGVGPQGTGHGGPMGHTFPTKSHLPEGTRRQSIEVLNAALADTTDLLTQVKFAHWNVRGENFYQLHELFEDLADRLATQADDIAERATALGGQAMGTARIAAATSRVPEMRTDAVTGSEYVELIAERLAVHDANLYEHLQQVAEREDLDTADLLNEISRDVSTFRWFLEAHFVTQPSETGRGGQQSGTGPTSIGGQGTMGQQPGMGMERQPGPGGTSQQSGMEQQPGIERQSGMGMERQPGMGMGTEQQPGTGMGQQSGMSTEQQPGMGTERQFGTGPQPLGDHQGGRRIQVRQGGQEPPRF